jgi:hypothetical protein
MPPPCAVLLVINRKNPYLRHGTDPSLRLEEVHRPGGSKVLPWLTQPAPTVGTVGKTMENPWFFLEKSWKTYMVFSGKMKIKIFSGTMMDNLWFFPCFFSDFS